MELPQHKYTIMKILNLLEAPYTTKFRERKVSRVGRPSRGENSRQRGAFSVVSPDKADPHMVKKNSTSAVGAGRKEGFRLFIEFIVENGHTDNIHFPRVYEAKKVKNTKGDHIDIYKTEKLISWVDIDHQLIDAYAKTVIDESEFASFLYDTDDTVTHQMLALLIRNATEGDRVSFKSKELERACEIVKDAVEFAETLYSDNNMNDLHFNNIMYRRVNNGIQIVLNDPIAADTY